MESVFLGLDVGTSSCKAVLIRPDGTLVAQQSREYPVSSPRPLWSEQNPNDWWRESAACIRALLADRRVAVEAVGLTGQMHGLVLLDSAGEIIRPAILWNDQRSAPQCAALTQRVGAARVLQLTGNPILPGFTAPKLQWVRENEPGALARVRYVLLPKDFIRFRMSGTTATDVSDASGTAWLDVAARGWSEEMLAVGGVSREWLSDVYESPAICARIHGAAAAATGLRAGTPIVAGGGDQAAQAVGSGITRVGRASATIGTSGVVFAPTDAYRVAPQGRLHAFCHAVPGMWHLMGVMLSAGGSYDWFCDTLAERPGDADVHERTAREAERIPLGAEGLLFLPYLSGERTPHPDPFARGVFCGLTLRHARAHLARAVIEGVSFGLRDSLELLRESGVAPREIRVSGGGARSSLWRQILADIFRLPIVTTTTEHGAAYGAALLAAVGGGAFPDVPSAGDVVREQERINPGPGAARYESLYAHYRALYPALVPHFASLSRWVDGD